MYIFSSLVVRALSLSLGFARPQIPAELLLSWNILLGLFLLLFGSIEYSYKKMRVYVIGKPQLFYIRRWSTDLLWIDVLQYILKQGRRPK